MVLQKFFNILIRGTCCCAAVLKNYVISFLDVWLVASLAGRRVSKTITNKFVIVVPQRFGGRIVF